MSRRKRVERTKALLEYLANAQHEAQLTSQRQAAQVAAVVEKNAALAAAKSELKILLKLALATESAIDLESLKIAPAFPALDMDRPRRRNYLPEPLSRRDALIPWKAKAHQAAYQDGESAYKKARGEYEQAELEHARELEKIRAEADDNNQAIEAFILDFAQGKPAAIVEYFKRVLARSVYPPNFPRDVEVVYAEDRAELRIELALPTIEVVPAVERYSYDRDTGETAAIPMPAAERQRLYKSILAQICLRTAHEVFAADRSESVDCLALDGWAQGIDPSSGQSGRFRLVSLRLTREQFDGLDLQHIEPLACMTALDASISSEPHALLPVPGGAQSEAAETRKALTDEAEVLRQRVKELESANQELDSQRIELENKLIAQVDENVALQESLRERQTQISVLESQLEARKLRLADILPALRAEQERNADLTSEQTRKDAHIARLEQTLSALRSIMDEPNAARTETRDMDQLAASTIESDDEQVPEEAFEPSPDEEAAEPAVIPADTEPFHALEMEDADAGYDVPIPPPGAISEVAAESEPNGTVTLGELLRGGADNEGGELTERPPGTPDDLLTDLSELVSIMGDAGSETARLIKTMAENDWACSHQMLEASFVEDGDFTFANNIIDEINDRAYDHIDHPLIIEDGGRWVIEDEFRDEITHILQHADYLNYARMD